MNKKFPTQKNQQIMNLSEDQARQHIEKLLWPDGKPVCRQCGSVNAYRMQGATCRPGLCRCRDCKKQFTVTVGTIFEDSHLPLATWVRAIHMMATSKKGISALQLQRNLGIGSYKTAWHLAHRIRLAMKREPVAGMLKGDVQVDETYVGRSRAHHKRRSTDDPSKRGRGTDKVPVLVLVETDGKAHSRPIAGLDSKTLKTAMEEVIHPSSRIITDEWSAYQRAAAGFEGGHETVKHTEGEYVRDGFSTNSAESYFSLFKLGIYGAFHHISKQHMHRYCDEFSFRWSERKTEDAARRDIAIQQVEGKRLMFHQPTAST
jgi:transposase-like protein